MHPQLRPNTRLRLDSVKEGSNKRPIIVEDSCIAVLLDSTHREQDHQ
jgi:hypothetical protein